MTSSLDYTKLGLGITWILSISIVAIVTVSVAIVTAIVTIVGLSQTTHCILPLYARWA